MKNLNYSSNLRHLSVGIIAVLVSATSLHADTLYWDGTSASWNTAANWSTASGATTPDPGTVVGATDDAIFNITTANSNINIGLDADQLAQSLTFNNTGATTIRGNVSGTTARQLTIGSGGITVNSGAGNATFGGTNGLVNILLSGSQTWTNNSSNSLNIGVSYRNSATDANLDLGTNQLTIDGSGRINMGVVNQSEAVLTGSGALIKNGTGLFSIGGINTGFSGNVIVNEGVLYYGDSPGALGTGNLLITGGAVEGRWNNAFTRTQGTGAGEIQITGGISGFGGGNNMTYNIGAITWGSSTFDPTEFILQTSNASSTGRSTLSSSIDLNGADRTIRSDQTGGNIVSGYGKFSGNITNDGVIAGLIKTGVGHHILSGTNTYDGGTTINQGSLFFDGIAAMPSSGNVQVNDGATLGIQVGGNGNWTTGTSGVGTLGGLLAGEGGAGSSTVGFSGNVGLQLDVVSNSTYSENIANVEDGTLAIHKTGNNSTLTLSGNNTYSGGTFLNTGTLIADSATALGSGDITFKGGTLQFTANSAATDFGSQIANSTSAIELNTGGENVELSGIASSNTGGLTKSGAGTLTLTGTNTYTGATTIEGGTLALYDGTVTSQAVNFQSNDTSMTVTGGTGVTSTWDMGGQQFGTTNGGKSNLQVVIDGGGVAGNALVTNVGTLVWGKSATNNSTILLTDGGQMNVNGQIRIGNPYYLTTGGANLTIGGGTATSTFTGNAGQDFYIGYGERQNSNNNVVTVNSGGVLTGSRHMFVGHVDNGQGNGLPSTANRLTVTGTGTASMTSVTVGYAERAGFAANANVVEVTNGGTLSTTGPSYIGRSKNSGSASNDNTLTVSGTGSSWNAGDEDVYVGHTNNASAVSNDNILTVGTGGSLTNVNTLTVGGGTGTTTGNQLVVNGSLTATTVIVSSGNSLQGSGTITSSVTINDGGTLAAGNSIESLATGDLSLEAASTFAYEMDNGAAAGVAGDLTAVTGDLNLFAGALLTLTELGAESWTGGDKLTLISYSGTLLGAGTFDYLGNTLADDTSFNFSGTDWDINYNDTDAGTNYTSTGLNYVTITAAAVPEPSTIALLGLGGLALILRRRRM